MFKYELKHWLNLIPEFVTDDLIETRGHVLKIDLVKTTSTIQHWVTDRQNIQYKDNIEHKSLKSKQTEELKPIIHPMCLSL